MITVCAEGGGSPLAVAGVVLIVMVAGDYNDDGSVEAWFEGDPDDVDVMVHFAGIGPSGAYVDLVDVDEVEPEGLRGFEVR